jgi:hypothetical protein
LNGITSVPNFMKMYHTVQKLLVGETQTDRDRQTGDLISLLSFLEIRLYKKFWEELIRLLSLHKSFI